MEKFKSYIISIVSIADSIAKTAAGIVVIVGIVSLIIPGSLLGVFEAYIASNRGLQGYIYYEIGKSNEEAKDGKLLLLGRDIEELQDLTSVENIGYGDKFMVQKGKQRLRESSTKNSVRLYSLHRGECVIVIGDKVLVETQNAVSGGWLHVATTSCGIFK